MINFWWRDAEPQRNERCAFHVEDRHRHGREQARQVPSDRDPAGIHRIRSLLSFLAKQELEQLVDRRELPFVVEAAEVRIVPEAPLDLGNAEPGFERLWRSGAAQEIGERLVASARSLHGRPVGQQSAEDRRLSVGHDVALERLAIHALIFSDRPHVPRLAVPRTLR
jgi:hypothetical protein